VDLLVGILTALLGLGFVAAPWVFPPRGGALVAATIIAGGTIVTLLGFDLARRARGAWRAGRRRS
jgi:hypothetical protein